MTAVAFEPWPKDGEAVDNLEMTKRYAIRAWTIDGEQRYDWMADNGDESSELFDSVEDAKADIRGRHR